MGLGSKESDVERETPNEEEKREKLSILSVKESRSKVTVLLHPTPLRVYDTKWDSLDLEILCRDSKKNYWRTPKYNRERVRLSQCTQTIRRRVLFLLILSLKKNWNYKWSTLEINPVICEVH